MNNVATGQQAEAVAAQFLEQHGYSIRERNWRTKVCEIDIVAEKDDCLHFVEVKFREHPTQGSGIEYITSKKLRQMNFAAEIYSTEQRWTGPVNLAGIEVSGPTLTITNFVESINYDF